MPSYLSRYQAGEHEAVWRELCAEGEAVWTAPLHEDAAAVARATMTRVETNLVRLRDRLLDLGFAFAEPDAAWVPAQPSWERELARIEARGGRLCLAGRAWYERFHDVCFTQALDQLEGRAGPVALHGLGSHPALVLRSLSHGERAFARFEEAMARESEVVGRPLAVEPHLPVGPLLSNGDTASFRLGEAGFDEPLFADDGRDPSQASFIAHLRETILDGGGFPFWSRMTRRGLATPAWMVGPSWGEVSATLTRDLERF